MFPGFGPLFQERRQRQAVEAAARENAALRARIDEELAKLEAGAHGRRVIVHEIFAARDTAVAPDDALFWHVMEEGARIINDSADYRIACDAASMLRYMATGDNVAHFRPRAIGRAIDSIGSAIRYDAGWYDDEVGNTLPRCLGDLAESSMKSGDERTFQIADTEYRKTTGIFFDALRNPNTPVAMGNDLLAGLVEMTRIAGGYVADADTETIPVVKELAGLLQEETRLDAVSIMKALGKMLDLGSRLRLKDEQRNLVAHVYTAVRDYRDAVPAPARQKEAADFVQELVQQYTRFFNGRDLQAEGVFAVAALELADKNLASRLNIIKEWSLQRQKLTLPDDEIAIDEAAARVLVAEVRQVRDKVGDVVRGPVDHTTVLFGQNDAMPALEFIPQTVDIERALVGRFPGQATLAPSPNG